MQINSSNRTASSAPQLRDVRFAVRQKTPLDKELFKVSHFYLRLVMALEIGFLLSHGNRSSILVPPAHSLLTGIKT